VKDGQAQLVLHGMPALLQSKVVPALKFDVSI
jgi:hypothetical protein